MHELQMENHFLVIFQSCQVHNLQVEDHFSILFQSCQVHNFVQMLYAYMEVFFSFLLHYYFH